MDKIITDGVKKATFRKATAYLSMSTELSNKHAIELLTGDTLNDYIPAQRSLAMLYLQNGERDKSLSVFHHLSTLGDHIGHMRIACSLIESNKDLTEARALFEKAAISGNFAAKYYLGRILIDGVGGAAEPKRGKALLNEVEGSVFEDK